MNAILRAFDLVKLDTTLLNQEDATLRLDETSIRKF